ncbi:hypothetical protein MUY14_42945 [Amycolatopsis sp. FBCC-B4732]|nr:hypothetical protein [Amycolatopsis sp. FBCC-B4732]UOX88371.1 hypothetical protein MUY14_42945 [Amycolatopsis sp. FBCC-B4732]
MATFDVRHGPLQAVFVGLPLTIGSVVDAAELGRQGCATVFAEDPLGEEAGHGVQDAVFADVDAVAGLRLVVLVGFTLVVRGGAAASAAEHAAAAVAEHHSAEQVLPAGLGVLAQPVADLNGTSLRPAARSDLVVHPLRDQRLVDRLG